MLILFAMASTLSIPGPVAHDQRAESAHTPAPPPGYSMTLTVMLCEVRSGSVDAPSCAATLAAGDYSALYVVVSQTGYSVLANDSVTVSGSSGIPLAWTSAWNSQSSCGGAPCENGFYGAATGNGGSYGGYSYCEPASGSTCGYSGQGAAAAPATGTFTVTVCIPAGNLCASAAVGTTGSTTTTSAVTSTAPGSTTTTATASTSSAAAVPVFLFPSNVGAYAFLNATLGDRAATGTVDFNGTGPNGVKTTCTGGCAIGCAVQDGTCGVTLRVQPGRWTFEASYGDQHSYADLTVAGVTTPTGCFGNGAISQSFTGSYNSGFTYTGTGNTGNYLYVADKGGARFPSTGSNGGAGSPPSSAPWALRSSSQQGLTPRR